MTCCSWRVWWFERKDKGTLCYVVSARGIKKQGFFLRTPNCPLHSFPERRTRNFHVTLTKDTSIIGILQKSRGKQRLLPRWILISIRHIHLIDYYSHQTTFSVNHLFVFHLRAYCVFWSCISDKNGRLRNNTFAQIIRRMPCYPICASISEKVRLLRNKQRSVKCFTPVADYIKLKLLLGHSSLLSTVNNTIKHLCSWHNILFKTTMIK